MIKEKPSKIKLLALWELLCRESAEAHPLSTGEILARLGRLGILCDRRTLYADIAALNASGREVMCIRGQHSNAYYVADHAFEPPELRILIDAVQAAGFIDATKTAVLIDKIAALGGEYRAEQLKNSLVLFNTTKHNHTTTFYAVDTIENAIIADRQLSFRYFDYDRNARKIYRKEGERYRISPVATVFTMDNYYLLGCHGCHKDMSVYRVDRMSDVETEAEAASDQSVEMRKNVAVFRKQAFAMFGGETVTAHFEASDKLLDVIFDRFGEATPLTRIRDGWVGFSVEIQPSNVFFGWCLGFGGGLKLVAPQSLVDDMKKYLASARDLYTD